MVQIVTEGNSGKPVEFEEVERCATLSVTMQCYHLRYHHTQYTEAGEGFEIRAFKGHTLSHAVRDGPYL